jgi:hypothetical protein
MRATSAITERNDARSLDARRRRKRQKRRRRRPHLVLRDGRIFFFDSAIEGDDDPVTIPAADRAAVGSPGARS